MTSPVTPDDVTTQIATLEQTVSGLIDPARFADNIMDSLNDLAQQEADPASLEAIYSNASALTDTASTLNQTMQASLKLARSVQQQRDAAKKALDDLREAMRRVDTLDPEISAFYDSVEEVLMVWHQESWVDDMYEMLIDEAINFTCLDGNEVGQLLDMLTGDGPDYDHYLWHELREWIRRAEHVVETGHEPVGE